MTEPIDTPTTVTFKRWPLGGDATDTYDVRSLLVERTWCSTLGPTSLLLLRLVADLLAHTDTVKVEAVDLAQLLGVGGGNSKCGVLANSLGRLERFGAAQQVEAGTWAVRSRLPSPSDRQLAHHGALVRAFHLLLTSRPPAG